MQVMEIKVKGWAGVDEVRIVNPPDWLIELFSVENGEGKTSFVEALRNAMGGGTLPSGAIRDGENEAEVEIIFDEASIRCTVAREKGRAISLKVRDEKTGKLRALPSGQQTWLNGAIGTMLDPSGFADMDADKRKALVQSLAAPEWLSKLGELHKKVKAAEEERTLAGRLVRDFGDVVPVDPVEPVNVVAIAEELRQVEAANRQSVEARATWERETARHKEAHERRYQALLEVWQRNQENRAEAIQRGEERLAARSAEVERLELALVIARAEQNKAMDALKALPAPERQSPESEPSPDPGQPPEVVEQDTAALAAKLADANEITKRHALYTRSLERAEERKRLVLAHEAREREVATARDEMIAHEKKADLPEGLAIGSDGLTFDGRPMHRMSDGEGRVLAFRIAARRNQKILVMDGAEALGPASVATIYELAKQHKIWVILCTRGTPHTEGAYELYQGHLITEEEIMARNAALEAEAAAKEAEEAAKAADAGEVAS